MAPKGDMPRERSRSPRTSSSAPSSPSPLEQAQARWSMNQQRALNSEGGFGVFTVPDDLTAAKDKAFMDLRKAIKASTAAASEVQAKLEAYRKAKARAAAAAAAAANANVSFPMTQQALEELLDIDSEAEPDPPQFRLLFEQAKQISQP